MSDYARFANNAERDGNRAVDVKPWIFVEGETSSLRRRYVPDPCLHLASIRKVNVNVCVDR
jgi:hypothetical protein